MFAQCADSYFKPYGYSLFSERVEFDLLSSADISGDGLKDAVGYVYNQDNTQIQKALIAIADNQGNFGNPVMIQPVSPIQLNGIKPVDFDSNGVMDLVIALRSTPRSVVVYKNDGALNFSPLTASLLDTDETIENVVDINNDDVADLLTYKQTQPGTFQYRLGNADGTFGDKVQIEDASYRFGADFNNDGLIDFPQKDNADNLNILINQGNGIFSPQSTGLNLPGLLFLGAANFNNDNFPDLYLSNLRNTISILTNNGDNTFTKTDYPVSSNMVLGSVTLLGDFNGDGFRDLMTIYSVRKPYYTILQNNGSGGFSRTDYDVDVLGLPFDDLDGDDKTDLLRINTYSFQNNNNFIKIFNESQLIVEKNRCAPPGATTIVDFDADRTTDRVHWDAPAGTWKTDYINVGGAAVRTNFQWGAAGDIPTPGDFDGDGETDYAVFRPSNGVWYIRRSSDGAFQFTQFGLSEDIPVAFDFDGDDKTDIAVYRPAEGVWYIINSETQQFSIVNWGLSEDKPVPADFDGDGKADLAVYRPSEGIWYVLRSSDGGFTAVKWGVSEDKPLPADYDGDGRADFTVFRPSENVWYILRSFNGQFATVPFGTNGDIMQPGDWNGDGTIELGVYRPDQQIWYFSNTIVGREFGSPGDVPIGTIQKVY